MASLGSDERMANAPSGVGSGLDDGTRRARYSCLPREHPSRSSLDHLTHEYELKDEPEGMGSQIDAAAADLIRPIP